jgi:hypothetical protein
MGISRSIDIAKRALANPLDEEKISPAHRVGWSRPTRHRVHAFRIDTIRRLTIHTCERLNPAKLVEEAHVDLLGRSLGVPIDGFTIGES